MKNLRVLKNKIRVEELSQKTKKEQGALFVEAQVADSQGVIVALGEDYNGNLELGMRVYFGRDTQQIRMTGKDVKVMEPDNVIAIVGNVDETSQKDQA